MYITKFIPAPFLQLTCILLALFVTKNTMADTESVKLDISTFPPITEDIQALASFNKNAKPAGLRLIERSDEILTIAHGVLADANTPYPQRLQLLYILGEIGNEASVAEIIHAIEDFPNNRYLYQNALIALSNFEPNKEIKRFVNQQLEITKRDPLIQRSALNYYAKQPDEDAKLWIDKYALNNSANPEVRYTALYMAGMNGESAAKEPIANLLDSAENATREYYLLLGFAGVSSMEEFNALVQSKTLNIDNVNKAREFLEFRLANTIEKKGITPDSLNSNNTHLKQAAIKYLIKEKDVDALASNWQSGDSAVRSAVKRAGYTIEPNERGELSLINTQSNQISLNWLFIVTVLCGLLIVALIVKRRNT